MRELGEKLGVIHSWVGKVEQGDGGWTSWNTCASARRSALTRTKS